MNIYMSPYWFLNKNNLDITNPRRDSRMILENFDATLLDPCSIIIIFHLRS